MKKDGERSSSKKGPVRSKKLKGSRKSDVGVSGSDSPTIAPSHPSSMPVWTCLMLTLCNFLLGLGTPVIWRRRNQDSSIDGGPSLTYEEWEAMGELVHPCGQERLQDFLHDDPVSGFHIVCFHVTEEDDLVITMFRNGVKDDKIGEVVKLEWGELKSILEVRLHLPEHHADYHFQPWAGFSSVGRRLFEGSMKESDWAPNVLRRKLRDNPLSLIYVGGQFVWPGVQVGFERKVDLYSVMPLGSTEIRRNKQTVTLKTLSVSPLILSIDGFLEDKECSKIQRLSAPSLKYSEIVLKDRQDGLTPTDYRTGQSAFISSTKDLFLQDIDERVASLTRISRTHQEWLEVLLYSETEKYDHHTDFFEPSHYVDNPARMKLIQNGRRNRLATVFFYLSNVDVGGETVFPNAYEQTQLDPDDCSRGVVVQPEKGKALLFYSMTMDGKVDESSLHGGCRVEQGMKWAANKWVWNEMMMYVK